jgi:DNA polymerase III sliding clamp (beta) subunit (PCNA family)
MKINSWEWKNLVHHASKDATKFHLCGIFIDAERKKLVSTNGHGLAILTVEEMPLKKSVIIEIPKLTVKNNESVRIFEQDDTLKLSVIKESGVPVLTADLNTMNVEYPDYNRVIPEMKEEGQVKEIMINPDLLPLNCNRIKVEFNNNLSPFKMTGYKSKTETKRMSFVGMPMKL